MSGPVSEHPSLRRWLRLLAEVDAAPGDTVPALSGLDDVDPDRADALSHRWGTR